MVCPDVMPDMNFAQEDNEWHLENGGAAKNMLLKYFYGLRYEMTPEDINAVIYSINMWVLFIKFDFSGIRLTNRFFG